MKKTISFFVLIAFMYGCGSVPITGRQQLLLVSDEEVLSLSLKEYNEYIKTAPKSTDKVNTEMVLRVGQNIADAVKMYYQSVNQEALLSGYDWAFNLIKDDQVNAFCMPGGKIVIYEGILPYTQTEAGLAVVIGHEVAHAIAKHANERMSQQMAAEKVGNVVGSVLKTDKAKSIGNTVFGLGAQYGVMLPYSRKQEHEADRLGLIFMAIAGYDPGAAIPFWQRMSAQGGAVPEFLSTHPSDQTRMTKIKNEYLPEALECYQAIYGTLPSGTGTGTQQPPANNNNNNNNNKTNNQWSF